MLKTIFYCLIFLVEIHVFNLKEQHLYEVEIFCNIKMSAVNSDHFFSFLMNIYFFKKVLTPNLNASVTWFPKNIISIKNISLLRIIIILE